MKKLFENKEDKEKINQTAVKNHWEEYNESSEDVCIRINGKTLTSKVIHIFSLKNFN
ncbi:hypothetical protein ACQUW5_00730 [Legionella sp. CNM-1927-20]|uniref:hypothetical protein n=1 Tax=Legionella sp. CNM-1927-20 TaxID=3422221 RepID=UPI00403B22C5